VLVASIFHYGQYTIPEVREALLAAGVPMRPYERQLRH
jgi:imidazole glycerol phosphate synthase subunit HisF